MYAYEMRAISEQTRKNCANTRIHQHNDAASMRARILADIDVLVEASAQSWSLVQCSSSALALCDFIVSVYVCIILGM